VRPERVALRIAMMGVSDPLCVPRGKVVNHAPSANQTPPRMEMLKLTHVIDPSEWPY